MPPMELAAHGSRAPNGDDGPTPAAWVSGGSAAGEYAASSAAAAPAAKYAPEQAADNREDRDQQARPPWPRESHADSQHVVHDQPARERGQQRSERREAAPQAVLAVSVTAGPVATRRTR